MQKIFTLCARVPEAPGAPTLEAKLRASGLDTHTVKTSGHHTKRERGFLVHWAQRAHVLTSLPRLHCFACGHHSGQFWLPFQSRSILPSNAMPPALELKPQMKSEVFQESHSSVSASSKCLSIINNAPSQPALFKSLQ